MATTPQAPLNEHRYSTTDIAANLGVSTETIRRWTDQGRIPHIRTPGGHRRYSEAAILIAADLLLGRTETRRG